MSAVPANVSAQPKPGGYHVHPREEMLAFVPADARRVLDVGCGEGLFGAALKTRGAEVWGIELAAAAARAASGRLDHVLASDVDGALSQLPAGTFDCVVFNDVLEHLVDPYSVLAKTRTLLSPRGVVVASIPNVRHYRNLWNLLAHKQWRYEDEGVLDRTHLRFFTERSIADMFANLDYEILRLQPINGFTSWKFRLLGQLSFGMLSDVFNPQFACVVKPRHTA